MLLFLRQIVQSAAVCGTGKALVCSTGAFYFRSGPAVEDPGALAHLLGVWWDNLVHSGLMWKLASCNRAQLEVMVAMPQESSTYSILVMLCCGPCSLKSACSSAYRNLMPRKQSLENQSRSMWENRKVDILLVCLGFALVWTIDIIFVHTEDLAACRHPRTPLEIAN